MSFFISFEGGEGSGKSTQGAILARWIVKQGFPVTLVREPGSTRLGNHLRRLLKGKQMSPAAELLLFAAARAELVETVVRPALEQGRAVVADRYADSTVAYQRYGRKIAARLVDAANNLATQGLKPDVTFLLDLPPEDGLRRVGNIRPGPPGEGKTHRADDPEQLRFEREPLLFHRRVRAGYRKLVEKEPLRWVVINATEPMEQVTDTIRREVARRLPSIAGPSGLADLLDLTGAELEADRAPEG